jgi:hypothetical protein
MMTKTLRVVRIAVFSALSLVFSSCSTGGGAEGGPAAEPADRREGVQLAVTNEQRMEADIWVYVDGVQRRVGTVRALSSNDFVIPMDRARRLRLEFRIFGGPTCVTREVSMLPGEAASYTIPMNIQLFDAVCRGDF